MTDKIKIDIVSDIVCPWCAVGYKRLAQAIKELELEDKVSLEWKPFELNPNMANEGQNIKEHLSEKYRISEKQIEDFQKQIVQAGKEFDFKFDFFEDMKIFNTFDAHILLDLAKRFGKQKELKIRFMEVYFSERKDISNREILLEEVANIGLDIEKAKVLLDDEDLINKIKLEETQVLNRGINSVPTMIFNANVTMSGAYPVENYKETLKELIK